LRPDVYRQLPEKFGDKFEYKMISSGKEEQPVGLLQKMANMLSMRLPIWVQLIAHPFRIEKNMATNIYGPYITASTFSWLI
jgi:hypothetical protein